MSLIVFIEFHSKIQLDRLRGQWIIRVKSDREGTVNFCRVTQTFTERLVNH